MMCEKVLLLVAGKTRVLMKRRHCPPQCVPTKQLQVTHISHRTAPWASEMT